MPPKAFQTIADVRSSFNFGHKDHHQDVREVLRGDKRGTSGQQFVRPQEYYP